MNQFARTPASTVRWAVSAGAAAIVMVVFVILFGTPAEKVVLPHRSESKPPISLTNAHSDELAMRDLAPLFLPTKYNASVTTYQVPQPGSAYFERDPGTRMFFDPETPSIELPSPVHAPNSAVEAVVEALPPAPRGIGRSDRAVAPSAAVGGRVDIFAGDSHDSVLGMMLPADAKPVLGAREVLGWKPLEFVAAVDAGGLVGPLTLTSGSGLEEVDNHFRNYLARVSQIGDRLPPGFYRIVVAP